MKYLKKTVVLAVLSVLVTFSIAAQSQRRIPKNPKWTVIIDYVDSFQHHKPGHSQGGGEEPSPGPDHSAGHFELIGGAWDDATPGDGVVDPALNFVVDLRLFPAGSDQAILDAFSAWEAETVGTLLGPVVFADADVLFADGINTYSMRNLGGGGVLAATFITWDDLDANNQINNGEPFLEMDVIHNFTVKWAIAESPTQGRWWDVQNVATHEIGHVYGLDHPGDSHEEDKRQTMFASAASKETSKRTLEPDGDIPGIQSDFLGY